MSLIITLAAACFAGAVSIRVTDPIVPELAGYWQVQPAVIALLASAFAFPYALSQPILGPIADTFGKARIIKIGLAVLSVATLIVIVTPSIEVLFAARILSGLAGGAIIPVALAMVGDRVPLADRQIALSHLLSAMTIAQLISLSASGWIASVLGWRGPFFLTLLVTLIALSLVYAMLRPRPIVEREPFKPSELPKRYRRIFTNPRAKFCYGAVFVEGALIFGLLPFVAVMLEARGAGSIAEAGIVLSGMAVGGLIYAAGLRRLLARVGSMFQVIRIGAGAALVGFAGVAYAGPWPFEMAAFCLLGFGFYGIHNVIQTQATELAPDQRGAAVALHAFFFFLGHACGPPIYAVLIQNFGAPFTIMLCGVIMALTAFGLASALEHHAKLASSS